jgi:hypothetical protein
MIMSMETIIPDSEFERLKATLNETIHELVFAVKFMEDDQIEEAQNALLTASSNVNTVAEELLKYES